MPRLSQTQADKQFEAIKRRIGAYVFHNQINKIPVSESASRLGMSYDTFMRRCKKPGSFTLAELQFIANVLNISLASLLDTEAT